MFLLVCICRVLTRLLAKLCAAVTTAIAPIFRTLSGPIGVAIQCTPMALVGFSMIGRVPHGTRGRPRKACFDVECAVSSRLHLVPFGAMFCQPVWVAVPARGGSFSRVVNPRSKHAC
jgi:hypothetical protein